jgi:hypothetical protein
VGEFKIGNGIDISAFGDKELDHVRMIARHSVVERCPAKKILAIDICTVVQEEVREVREPFSSGAMQRGTSPGFL